MEALDVDTPVLILYQGSVFIGQKDQDGFITMGVFNKQGRL